MRPIAVPKQIPWHSSELTESRKTSGGVVLRCSSAVVQFCRRNNSRLVFASFRGGDTNRRLAFNGKIHRVGDEAFCVRVLMQFFRHGEIGVRRHGYARPQCHLHKVPATIGGFFHGASRAIFVVEHDDFVDRAQVQSYW